jgi:hypothetical protein
LQQFCFRHCTGPGVSDSISLSISLSLFQPVYHYPKVTKEMNLPASALLRCPNGPWWLVAMFKPRLSNSTTRWTGRRGDVNSSWVFCLGPRPPRVYRIHITNCRLSCVRPNLVLRIRLASFFSFSTNCRHKQCLPFQVVMPAFYESILHPLFILLLGR